MEETDITCLKKKLKEYQKNHRKVKKHFFHGFNTVSYDLVIHH